MIDPAPAIARQVQRVLHRDGIEAPATQHGDLLCYTSGTPAGFKAMMERLGMAGVAVRQAVWEGDVLHL